MDSSRLKELSQYRLSRAKEEISVSDALLSMNMYKDSLNRSYYAIFHAVRAITALDDFDTKKHSGLIAYFNQHYIKTGIFQRTTSKLIKNASDLRGKSDYDDFYVASKEEAEEQLASAKIVVQQISEYLQTRE